MNEVAAASLSGDAVTGAIWFMASGVSAVAAWKWARALCTSDTPARTMTGAVVLFWATSLGTAILLSLAGTMTGRTYMGAQAVCALAALIVLRGRQLDRTEPRRFPSQERFWHWAWGTLAGFLLGHALTSGLLKFPSDWDSLNYHIPLVDHWLQASSLYAPDALWWSQPGGNEVLGLWLAAPFSGDFLVQLMNVPAVVLLAASAVELASALGLSPGLAHLAGMLLVCHHVVFHQIVDAENDVAVAALFFACLSCLFRYLAQPKPANLLLGAIAVGLLAGIKFYAFGYAFLLVVAWPAFALRLFGWRRAVLVLAALTVGLLLCGGYWYVRNLAVSGSPLYPKDFFRQPDMVALSYPDSARTSFWGNGRPELLGLFVEALWKIIGPAHLAAFLFVPCSAVWLAVSGTWFLWKREPLAAAKRLGLGFVLCGTGLLLAVTPFAVEDQPGTLNQLIWGYCPARYGLCFLSSAVLAMVLTLQDCVSVFRRSASIFFARVFSYLPHALVTSGLAVQFLLAIQRGPADWLDDLLAAINFLLAVAIVTLVLLIWPRRRGAIALMLVVAGAAGWGFFCDFLSQSWHRGFAAHYRRSLGIPHFSKRTDGKPLDGKICVLEYRAYPFFGSRRQYRVCQPGYVFSAEWLMHYLEEKEVAIVIGVRNRPILGSRTFLWFDECLARHAERFREIENRSGALSVFAFKKRPNARRLAPQSR